MKKILLVALMALCAASLSYAVDNLQECMKNCTIIYGNSDDLLAECYSGCHKTYNSNSVTPNVKNDDSSSEYGSLSRPDRPYGHPAMLDLSK